MPAPHEQRVPCAQGTSVGRSPAPRTASAWCRGRHGLHAATASRSRREQSVCRIDAGPCDRRRFSCPDEPTSGPSRPRIGTRPADPAVAPGATYAEPAPVRASAEAGSCRLDKRLAGIRTTGSARAIGAARNRTEAPLRARTQAATIGATAHADVRASGACCERGPWSTRRPQLRTSGARDPPGSRSQTSPASQAHARPTSQQVGGLVRSLVSPGLPSAARRSDVGPCHGASALAVLTVPVEHE